MTLEAAMQQVHSPMPSSAPLTAPRPVSGKGFAGHAGRGAASRAGHHEARSGSRGRVALRTRRAVALESMRDRFGVDAGAVECRFGVTLGSLSDALRESQDAGMAACCAPAVGR